MAWDPEAGGKSRLALELPFVLPPHALPLPLDPLLPRLVELASSRSERQVKTLALVP